MSPDDRDGIYLAGVAASFVSQPSDTILVEVNDKAGAEVDIFGTVSSGSPLRSCGGRYGRVPQFFAGRTSKRHRLSHVVAGAVTSFPPG